jgi:hypothetical protein
MSEIEVGSRWRRNPPGCEVVEVQRVWDYWYGEGDERPTVRAHPITGGRPLVAPIDYLLAHYTLVPHPTPTERPAAEAEAVGESEGDRA